MASQGPLRRWKRFVQAFASVGDAIEASNPAISRAEFRNTSLKILEMLINETEGSNAQKLCVVLDDVMIQSLQTLEMVAVTPKMLASTDLAKDIGDLRNHESERVRGLATGIVLGWRASVKADLAKATAAMEKLSQVMEHDEADHQAKIREPSEPKKTANFSEPSFPKKQSIGVGSNTDEKAINAAKRKLHEGYEEAEEAKRQRTVKVIEAPEMAKQRQRKMHPILRERSRSRAAAASLTSTRRRV